MKRKERINDAVKHLKFMGVIKTQKDIAKKMCTTPPNVSSALSGVENVLTDNFLKRFNEAFDHTFNMAWLLTGEGEMLNSESFPSNIPTKGIKILDIRVCAGYGIGFDGDENKVLDVVNIPQYNGCYGVTVYGDSMYDIYAPGDIVFVREVTDKTFIDNGQAYIVITAEDRLLKLLYMEDEKITLVSYNTTTNPDGRRKYPDICMKPESIIKLYKVVGRLTRGQM